jgi:hypothetical protein
MDEQGPAEPPGDGDRPPDDEDFVSEEEDAAAAEAAAIGGPEPNDALDPAERPLAEAGEGEAEGFEQAEQDLIEHASHGDPAPDPSGEDQLVRGAEDDAEEYGAADHFHSAEQKDEEQTH